MAQAEFTSASFYRFLGEGKLMASRCAACGALSVPPRAVCSECHGTRMEWRELSGRAKLAAFTSIAVAPSFMVEEGFGRERPYLVGIVELEEGPKVSARLFGLDATAPQRVAIGTPLRFKPVAQATGKRPYVAFEG